MEPTESLFGPGEPEAELAQSPMSDGVGYRADARQGPDRGPDVISLTGGVERQNGKSASRERIGLSLDQLWICRVFDQKGSAPEGVHQPMWVRLVQDFIPFDRGQLTPFRLKGLPDQTAHFLLQMCPGA